MSEMTPEQERFQQCLHAPGYTMQNFISASPGNLLPNKVGLQPQFFQHNLVSPHRVLKVWQNDPHANIRIFYYQLLCVTFEIETENGFNTTFMYNLIHIVFHQEFEILFTPDTEAQRDLYNDFQFKKLFAEFVSMIQNQESPNIEQILNAYPIMDTVFVHIFRSILATQGVDYAFNQKIPTTVVFSELCGLLGFNVESFNSNCWKFDDSDMFCYEHSETQIYLAFTKTEAVSTDAMGAEVQPKAYEYNNPIEPSYPSSSSYPTSNSYSSNSYQAATGYEATSSYQPQSSYQPAYEPLSYETQPAYTSTSPRPNFQSLEAMADRHVTVEPKHDIIEAPKPAGADNEVKESMISVTYEFVDFTGESTAYKDRMPRREATASGLIKTKPVETAPTGTSGLDQYMNKPADSLNNVNSSVPYSEPFKPKPIESYMSPLNTFSGTAFESKTDYNKLNDNFDSLYKSAAPVSSTFDYKPTQVYGSQSITASKPVYEPAYTTPTYTGLGSLDIKPSTALDSYTPSYKPIYDEIKPLTAAYDSKPLPIYQSKPLSSYDPKPSTTTTSYTSPLLDLKPQPIKQKFTNVLSLEATTSSHIFESKYQDSYKTPAPTRLQNDDLGDYYGDFTSDNLLNSVIEPYRSNVMQIKSRIRGWKKSGIFSRPGYGLA